MRPTWREVCNAGDVRGGQPYRIVTGIAACLAIVAATGCGRTSVTEVIAPDAVRCTAEISPNSASMPADGGRVTISITAARECGWSAQTDAPWVQLSAAAGQGSATLLVTATPNPNPSVRTAGVLINDQQLSLSQEARPCRFELRPTSAEIGSEGGEGSITVSASSGCAWQASTSASWVRVPSGTRTGSGSLEYEVARNDGPPRQAVIGVAGQSFTLSQTEHGTAPVPGPGPGPGPAPGPQPAGLGAPTGLAVRVVSDSRVDLSWTNTDPAAQTQVYRNGSLVATKDAGVTTHQDTGLTRATNYVYIVRHAKAGAVSPDSSNVVGRPVFLATGGTVSTAGGYRQHLFTSSGSFVVTQGGTIDEIIIIGGGGGGGGSEGGTEFGSGGGGAGGVRVVTMKAEANGTYTVVIGVGGGGGGSSSSNPGVNDGRRGGNSSYAGETAQGGGAGAGAASNFLSNPGGDGGSGGGGSGAGGGAGTSGEGSPGGAGFVNRGGAAGGGGGGGKGSAGSPADGGHGGNGGAGYSTWIGTVASGGRGGRGNGGVGSGGRAPGDGGQGNGPGGGGGSGANGAVLIRYRQ